MAKSNLSAKKKANKQTKARTTSAISKGAKKAKVASEKDSEESEHESDDEQEKQQRITAPKRIFKGDGDSSNTDFITWKRHIKLWRTRYR